MDTLKNVFVKIVTQVVIRNAYGTWHNLFTVTRIHNLQKIARNSQNLGNK